MARRGPPGEPCLSLKSRPEARAFSVRNCVRQDSGNAVHHAAHVYVMGPRETSSGCPRPSDPRDAAAKLGRLSGRTHELITAVALVGPGVDRLEHEVAHLSMYPLTEGEQRGYLDTNEWEGCAGGYRIEQDVDAPQNRRGEAGLAGGVE